MGNNSVSEDRISAVLEELRIRRPWSVSNFVAAVEDFCGRRIVVTQIESFDRPMPYCGFWFEAKDSHIVICEKSFDSARQDFIVCHELSHILLGHKGDPRLTGDSAALQAATLAGLPASQVVRARGNFSTPDEFDAELLARRVVARETAHSAVTSTKSDAVIRRIRSAL